MAILYKVQVGAFAEKANAEKRLAELREKGFYGVIIEVDDGKEKKPEKVIGARKVYELMAPYIDKKTAHDDFVKEYNKMMDVVHHSKITTKNAWCTMFINLNFWKAGYLDLIGYGKRAEILMEHAQKKGTWKSGSDDIKFGDVIICQNSKGVPNHSEFALGGNKFISGNMAGGVHIRTRNSLKTVKGRIRPKYPKEG
ncbi:MAG: SPOR domain-containing protein [Eubacteriales bacterium]|nr:SPOR domain-containing protein [Eubacteriales bacterium]